MKVELVRYMYENCGVALSIIPESDIERALLSSLFTFGKMGVTAGTFLITAYEAKKERINEKA